MDLLIPDELHSVAYCLYCTLDSLHCSMTSPCWVFLLQVLKPKEEEDANISLQDESIKLKAKLQDKEEQVSTYETTIANLVSWP